MGWSREGSDPLPLKIIDLGRLLLDNGNETGEKKGARTQAPPIISRASPCRSGVGWRRIYNLKSCAKVTGQLEYKVVDARLNTGFHDSRRAKNFRRNEEILHWLN